MQSKLKKYFLCTAESSAAAKRRDIRKKKKKIPSQLISFDDDYSRPDQADVRSPLYHSAPTTCLSSPAPTTASSTPFADRLEKYAHLQELEHAKKALKSAGKAESQSQEGVERSKGMGNVSGTSVKETVSPLQDCEEFENRGLDAQKSFTFDEDSMHESSYQQLFENILPKQIDFLPESNGNITSENSMGPNNAPITKPQRPNSIYNQETGSYKSNQSNLSADSFPSRLVSLTAPCLTLILLE